MQINGHFRVQNYNGLLILLFYFNDPIFAKISSLGTGRLSCPYKASDWPGGSERGRLNSGGIFGGEERERLKAQSLTLTPPHFPPPYRLYAAPI